MQKKSPCIKMQGRNIYPRYHPYFHKRELSKYLTRIKRHMLL